MKKLPTKKLLKKVIKCMNFPYSAQILRAIDIFGPDFHLHWFSAGNDVPGEPSKICAHFRRGAIEVANNGSGKFQVWQCGDDALTFEIALSKLKEIADDLPSPKLTIEKNFASLIYCSWS